MFIRILKHNNYYNRKYSKITEDNYDESELIWQEYSVNFNENDGVNASIILNVPSDLENQANYALLYTDTYQIISRWYIIDSRRTRLNQYEFTLRRDLLADYLDEISNAPIFVEKAIVGYGDSRLFNKEDMTFSQVKTWEKQLRDQTRCPWIVGYLAKDTESVQITATDNTSYVAEYESFQDLPFFSYLESGNAFLTEPTNILLGLRYAEYNQNGADAYQVEFNTSDYYTLKVLKGESTNYNQLYPIDEFRYKPKDAASFIAEFGSRAFKQNEVSFIRALENKIGITEPSRLTELLNTYPETGVTFKVGARYYKVRRSAPATVTRTISPTNEEEDLFVRFHELVNYIPILKKDILLNKPKPSNYLATLTYKRYSLTYEEIVPENLLSVTIPSPGTRNHPNDAPYDIFAIPYNFDTKLSLAYEPTYNVINNIDAEAGLIMAQKLVEQLTQAKVYDLQLLPYCPMRNLVSLGKLYYPNDIAVLDKDFSIIYRGDPDGDPKEVSVMLWCTSSQFSLAIDETYSDEPIGIFQYPIDVQVNTSSPIASKIQAMCDTLRLVSPNYNGQFEFNPVMNGGVRYFEIDCTYKPYSPYIKVAPDFKFMYGTDFDDARGLICGGDFSLPTITDQWKQYELNNKNYLNAFNRQIENMEINNRYQKQSEVVSAVAGALQGATSAATIGLVTGGGVGAVAGAAVGGLASGVAGAIDVSINEQLRNEVLDYTKDQFGYTLGNIRALPYTLNRVSSFNINNKIFPILEYYTAPDVEKKALENKIKWNGMTIMTIGTLNEFQKIGKGNYFKGKLINLEGFSNHTTIEIANELNKGIYI